MSAPVFFLQSFLDLRRFADSAAEVIELRSSDFTFTNNFDFCHTRAVHREHSFHTDTVGKTTHREGFVDAAVFLRDDRAFKDLDTFSRTFFDFDVNLNGVTDVEFERVFTDVLFRKCLEDVHFFLPFHTDTFIPGLFLSH